MERAFVHIWIFVVIALMAGDASTALSHFSALSVVMFGVDVSFIVRLIVVTVFSMAAIGGFVQGIQAFFDVVGQVFHGIGYLGRSIKEALTRLTRIFRRRKKTKQ